MALAWVLRHSEMTSVLIGASRESQVRDAVGALARLDFSAQELAAIDALVKDAPRA
jgi:L-glyceraldehyde 3-phosphate reductase